MARQKATCGARRVMARIANAGSAVEARCLRASTAPRRHRAPSAPRQRRPAAAAAAAASQPCRRTVKTADQCRQVLPCLSPARSLAPGWRSRKSSSSRSAALTACSMGAQARGSLQNPTTRLPCRPSAGPQDSTLAAQLVRREVVRSGVAGAIAGRSRRTAAAWRAVCLVLLPCAPAVSRHPCPSG